MGQEKTRLSTLARELNLEPADVLRVCKEIGLNVKNRVALLDAEQCRRVREFVQARRNPDAQPPARPGPVHVVPLTPGGAAGVPAQGQQVRVLLHVGRAPARPPAQPPTAQAGSAPEFGLDRLLESARAAGVTDLAAVPQVARLDPECALFKIRKVTERLCQKLMGSSSTDLNDLVRNISYKRLLGTKTVSYLHQIRTLGNAAVHPSGDQHEEVFTLDDVQNAAGALACVLDDLVKRKVLPEQKPPATAGGDQPA